jgi:hypothetical protein
MQPWQCCTLKKELENEQGTLSIVRDDYNSLVIEIVSALSIFEIGWGWPTLVFKNFQCQDFKLNSPQKFFLSLFPLHSQEEASEDHVEDGMICQYLHGQGQSKSPDILVT